MSLTYAQAIDEIFARFNQVWQTETLSILTDVPEIRWQGVEAPEKPPNNLYWVRVSQETIGEQQITLRNPSCGQRYRTDGILVAQLFCPRSDSRAMEIGRSLSTIAKNAFRAYKTEGGVWFRNSSVSELEPEDKWIRFNISVLYQYDETI